MSRFRLRSLCAQNEGHLGESLQAPQDGQGRETSPHSTAVPPACQPELATPAPDRWDQMARGLRQQRIAHSHRVVTGERFVERLRMAFQAEERSAGEPVSVVALRAKIGGSWEQFWLELEQVAGFTLVPLEGRGAKKHERRRCPTDDDGRLLTHLVRTEEPLEEGPAAVAEAAAVALWDPDGWPSCESWEAWEDHPANGERFAPTEEPVGLRHRQPLTATVARCPSCGYRVQLPCVACEVRGILTRQGPLPPAAEVKDDPPADWAWPCDDILLDEPTDDPAE